MMIMKTGGICLFRVKTIENDDFVSLSWFVMDALAKAKILIDAIYNDGWWVGCISKVLGDSKYLVLFQIFVVEFKLVYM
ncbi:hypothetical protein BVRB_2g031140 [Beta vulgaris subsp. vulgaris]|nr:hypothetical protein BVRB_2g031140 [Beta vulgaris subsp. vulgaris]